MACRGVSFLSSRRILTLHILCKYAALNRDKGSKTPNHMRPLGNTCPLRKGLKSLDFIVLFNFKTFGFYSRTVDVKNTYLVFELICLIRNHWSRHILFLKSYSSKLNKEKKCRRATEDESAVIYMSNFSPKQSVRG